MVDAVRGIPVVIERNMPQPMYANNGQTGFPFDKDTDRDASFRNQLDDIAKRHPELAEHFDGFPFRSNSFGRRQHSSDEADGFPRFSGRDRPFGSRFEQFGFPFTRDSGSPFAQEQSPDQYSPPEQHTTQQQHYSQPPQFSQQPQCSQPQQSAQSHVNVQQQQQPTHSAKAQNEEDRSEQRPPQAPERGRRQNIQQSNTADLSQKQEPVNERSQRSMSAPPSENRSQPRYVSSINIPIQRDPAAGDAGTHQSPHGTPQQKPTERVIPIHVEGRDEPVIPKNVHHTFAQTPPHATGFAQAPPHSAGFAQAPPHAAGYSHPEPEHIFGGRNMGDFMGRNAGRFPGREDMFGRQFQMPPEPQRFQQQKQQTPPRTQPMPPQQQQTHPQQQTTQPPQAPEPHPAQEQQQHPQQEQEQQQQLKPTPIDLIKAIQKDVSELMGQVEQFSGAPRDKQYLYLDEMLTRNLIKLDNIDTQGQENIRSARREAIKCIEKCIGVLESKANANVAAKVESMEVEQKPTGETEVVNDLKSDAKSEGQEQQEMETEVTSTTNENEQAAEQNKGVEAMEVAAEATQNQTEEKQEAAVTVTSEANPKGEDKTEEVTVGSSDSSKPQEASNKPKVETSSEAMPVTVDESKMDVESPKPAAGEGDNSTKGKDQIQPDSSSQTKEGSKDENKKEKKKGKKKEKTEKK